VLLAAAMIAVIGLTAAVVVLATDDDRDTSAGSTTQVSAPSPAGSTRHDGGPEEGTRGVVPARQPGVRHDDGPEEGTAALTQRSAPATFDPDSIEEPPRVRYGGGPEEGTRGALSPNAPSNTVPAAAMTAAPGRQQGHRPLALTPKGQSRTGPGRAGPFVVQRLVDPLPPDKRE
jgi:hypothetical protein